MSSKPCWIFLSLLIGAALSRAADPAAPAAASSSPAPAATPAPSAPATPLTPAEAYQNFVQQMVSPENLADLVAKIDTMIDEADSPDAPTTAAQAASRANTRNGVHLEFSIVRTPEVILYYAGLSRKNYEPLKYKEATMIFALICDRIGLTHPIHVTEGERPVFHAQWLIKPAEWKVLRKKMLEVRAENRAEKNLFKVMSTAVANEVNARVSTTQSNEAKRRK